MRAYEAIVIDGAPDPDLPGHIKVMIPELFGRKELPTLVPPAYPGWTAGGWQSVPSTSPPDGDQEDGDGSLDTRVLVFEVGPSSYRWFATSQGWSRILEAEPGTRCGTRSGDGKHAVIVDNTDGIELSVESGDGTTYIKISPVDDSFSVVTAGGAFITAMDALIDVGNSSGDHLTMDDGTVTIESSSGGMLVLSGDVATLSAAKVRLAGSQSPLALEPLVMGTSFLTDLSLSLTELSAIVALGFPTTNTVSMVGKITASLSAGAPYLSKISETE